MADQLRPLWDTIVANVPRLLGALGILLGAWIIALIVSALVRGALKRTTLDEKFFGWLGVRKDSVDSGRWISKAFYYVILLFGVMGFFNALGLTLVVEPLNRLLGTVFEYAPRVLSAGLLALVAFILATVVRRVVGAVLASTPLDSKLRESGAGTGGPSVSQSVAATAYWLVFLLFLPMILDALSLQGLLEPVQTMLNGLLGFLPNLFAAALILFLGWLVAKIVRQLVTNILAATGLDRVGARAGLDGSLGKQSLSGLVGMVAYALILIPVAISALDALKLGAVSEPAGQMLGTILAAIPAVFTAALIIGIAYMVGKFLASLVSELLARAGFNKLPAALGLSWTPGEGQRTPAEMVGYLTLVLALFFAATEAARQLQFEALAQIMVQLLEFGGNVLLGLVIFMVGLYLANLASNLVRSSVGADRAILATLTRVAILILASAMALRQMGWGEAIINMAFGLLVGAVALAAAIAFGLGSRDVAGRTVEGWSKMVKGDGPKS